MLVSNIDNQSEILNIKVMNKIVSENVLFLAEMLIKLTNDCKEEKTIFIKEKLNFMKILKYQKIILMISII
jgi:hypothetical protein